MGYSFERTCPVLRFAACAKPAYWAERPADGRRGFTWIGLPVWVWAVNAELRRAGELNAFQRMVLTLAGMQVAKAGEMAEAVGLDRDLTAFVLHEMQGVGFLDSNGDLTDSGRAALQEDSQLVIRTKRLFLFQDPWTGDLWPRATTELELATLMESSSLDSAQIGAAGSLPWPRLNESTPGRDNTPHVDFLVPGAWREVIPSAQEIGTAIAEWLRARPNASQGLQLAGTPQDAVRRLDQEPEAMWLVTQIYVPDEQLLERRWRVADPLLPGDLPWLRKRLHGLRASNAVRGNVLNRAISRLVGQGDIDSPDRAASFESEEYAALARFGSGITADPELYECTLSLLAAEAVLSASDGHPLGRARAGKLAASAAGNSLEILCRAMLCRYPLAGGVERARALLAGQLQAQGFGPCPDAWTAERMANGEFTGRELVALSARVAAAALQQPEHPLRRWLTPERNIQRFDAIRKWRNSASHANRDRHRPLRPEELLERLRDTLDFIEVAIPAVFEEN